MEKILFLTDFSQLARNAYSYALNLAENFGAELHILHIAPISHAATREEQERVHPVAQALIDRDERSSWAKFQAEAQELEKIAKNFGQQKSSLIFHFEEGDFIDVLGEFSDQVQPGLLVVGTAGNNNLDKKIFGSHAEQISENLRIPLLAVPAEARYASVRNFGMGVMLDQLEVPTVRQVAKRVLGQNTKKLQCVHIAKNEREAGRLSAKMNDWVQSVGADLIEAEIRVDPEVEHGLAKYATENQIDVLCILHRSHSYLDRLFRGTYSNRLVERSRTALMIFNLKK